MAISAGWTMEQLASLPDDGKRYEIIDGELYVRPSPAYRHQYAVLEWLPQGAGEPFVLDHASVFCRDRAGIAVSPASV